MADDVVNRFSRFRLKENEEDGVTLEATDIQYSQEECERSLLGRIWGEKKENFTGIKNTFSVLWCPKGDLKVVELGHNFYLFIFFQ